MRIAGILKGSAVNGEGLRLCIFMQGCGHHCMGCHNPETWDFAGGTEITPEDLAEEIKCELCKHPWYDGITLSGGDPYYQEPEVVEMLKLLPPVNVWVYTGYEWPDVKDRELTKYADAVVCGPYVEEQRCVGRMYGSSNQYIVRRKNQ